MKEDQEVQELAAELKAAEGALGERVAATEAALVEAKSEHAEAVKAADRRYAELAAEAKATADNLAAELKAAREAATADKTRIDDLAAQIKALNDARARGDVGGTWEKKASAKPVDRVLEVISKAAEDGSLAPFMGAAVREQRTITLNTGIELKQVDAPLLLSGGPTDWQQPYRDEPVQPPYPTLTVRDLVPSVPTPSETIQHVYLKTWGEASVVTSGVVDFPSGVAVVGEGVALPETTGRWDITPIAVQTSGHFFHASEQVLRAIDGLRADLDELMTFGIRINEDIRFLAGTGGLIDSAGTTITWSTTPAGTTLVDLPRLGVTALQKLNYTPTGLIMSPQRWESMELVKDDYGRYLLMTADQGVADGAPPRMWRLPVVVSTQIADDRILIGDFTRAARIYDYRGIQVDITNTDDVDFQKLMIKIRAYQQSALGIRQAPALVEIIANAAPTP